MPAAVVEVGFLSNPREAVLLSDPVFLKTVSVAIFAGLHRYFQDQP